LFARFRAENGCPFSLKALKNVGFKDWGRGHTDPAPRQQKMQISILETDFLHYGGYRRRVAPAETFQMRGRRGARVPRRDTADPQTARLRRGRRAGQCRSVDDHGGQERSLVAMDAWLVAMAGKILIPVIEAVLVSRLLSMAMDMPGPLNVCVVAMAEILGPGVRIADRRTLVETRADLSRAHDDCEQTGNPGLGRTKCLHFVTGLSLHKSISLAHGLCPTFVFRRPNARLKMLVFDTPGVVHLFMKSPNDL